MNRKQFEELLDRKAFYGSGGGIFQEYYGEALRTTDSLDFVIEDILSDLDEEYEDPDEDEIAVIEKLRSIDTTTLKNKMLFFETYIADRQCSFPELCGSVVGILSRDEYFQEAIDLIGLNDKSIEELYWWDS